MWTNSFWRRGQRIGVRLGSRLRPAGLLPLGFIVISGCAADPDPEPDLGADAEVQLEVDFAGATRPVGRLIGWNIGSSSRYAPRTGGKHPEWRSAAVVEAVSRLRQARAANGDRPLVRFSGLQVDGQLGRDGYHFWDYADPSAPAAETDNVAPTDYMAIVDEVEADPVITLNFGSGTAAEAADYVSYLTGTDPTDPLVAARQASGRSAPWPTDVFEVGNEIYTRYNTGYTATGDYSYANPSAANGGDPAWHGRPAEDADDYAARALAYVQAVVAVHPAARIYIPLTQSSWDGWGGPSAAIPRLAGLLEHPSVAGVVVHQYTLDDGVLGHGVNLEQDAWVLASADFLRPLYQELRETLGTLRRSTPLEISITEYHTVANLDILGRVGPTAATALGLADALMLYSEVGVESAMQHMSLHLSLETDRLSRSWHVPFSLEGDTVSNRPTYTITKLVAEHLHRQQVRVEAVSMPRARYALTDGEFEYDMIHAAAYTSPDQQLSSLMLLNRDLEAAHDVRVQVPEGWLVQSASQMAPGDLWADVDEANVSVSAAAYGQAGRNIVLTLPAHSFTTLQLTR